MAYAPMASAVLTVGRRGTPRVWDAAAGGSPVGRPLSHQASVHAVAFRPMARP